MGYKSDIWIIPVSIMPIRIFSGSRRLPSPQNADTILILDDEFDIMSIFTLALEQQGYHVIGFTEPLLALDHFQKNSDRYGLVISDLRMPVMNGYQFIKKVKEIKPQV